MSDEDMLDDDGYPTQALLDELKGWSPLGDFDAQMKRLKSVWWGDGVFRRGGRWVFCTSGWSGNEELISALQDNRMWWALCWYRSERGGRFEFKRRPA